MNEKQAKRLRQVMREDGLPPEQAVYRVFKVLSLRRGESRQFRLAPNCGRAAYQELKDVQTIWPKRGRFL